MSTAITLISGKCSGFDRKMKIFEDVDHPKGGYDLVLSPELRVWVIRVDYKRRHAVCRDYNDNRCTLQWDVIDEVAVFEVGDKVIRITGSYGGSVVGDRAEVDDFRKSSNSRTSMSLKYMDGVRSVIEGHAVKSYAKIVEEDIIFEGGGVKIVDNDSIDLEEKPIKIKKREIKLW